MNLVEAELHRRWGHEVIVGRRVMLTKGEGFGGVGGSYDAECASRSLALSRHSTTLRIFGTTCLCLCADGVFITYRRGGPGALFTDERPEVADSA